MKKFFKIFLAFLIIASIILFWQFKIAKHYPDPISLNSKPDFWGVTFSKRYTSYLHISYRELFLAIINDLGVKHIRLPMYWNDIAPEPNNYDWGAYDWFIEQAKAKNVKLIIVLGRRQPRWPECHIPEWAKSFNEDSQQAKILDLIKATIERYKYYDNIVIWQVENEALLDSFGICPKSDLAFFQQEIDLVKSLDTRPVLITGSGELSNWKREAELGNLFGTTMYRVVWGQWSGYLRYPFSPQHYYHKALKAGLTSDTAIIAELQAEPWSPGDIRNLNQTEVDKSFSQDQFEANLQFAINTNFKQCYLWGVEWWYYQKINGNPGYWNIAKGLKW